MKQIYETPDIEIIKFALKTCVLAKSNEGEGDIVEGTINTEPTVPRWD